MPRSKKVCATSECNKLTYGTHCLPHSYMLRTKHPDKTAYQREWSLQKKYGLSEDGFSVLWNAMRGMCGICGVILSYPAARQGQAPNSAVVDHNHKTGHIRGLLCNSCNKGLGLLKDNAEILQKAVSWVKHVN